MVILQTVIQHEYIHTEYLCYGGWMSGTTLQTTNDAAKANIFSPLKTNRHELIF